MFGSELIKIVNPPLKPPVPLTLLFLEIKHAEPLPISPFRLKRRYLADCKVDPKMTNWLAA